MQTVAELGHQTEASKTQQCHRITPGLHAFLIPVTHFGLDPAHVMRDVELLQHFKKCRVRCAVKMVIALDRQTGKIKTGRHATDSIICLEHHRLMTIPGQLIGDSQSHRASTEHGYTFTHDQNSRTTLLYTG